MNVFRLALALSASLVFGQNAPGNGIDSSSPCVPSNFENGSSGLRFTRLSTQADVDAISACQTFNGSIRIYEQFQGDVILPQLRTINGLISILPSTDSISVGTLTGLVFPSLTTMRFPPSSSNYQPEFLIRNITSLKTIWLPYLQNYTGYLAFYDLPRLTNLSVGNTLSGGDSENKTGHYIRIRRTSVPSISLAISDPTTDILIVNNPNLIDFLLLADKINSLTTSADNIRFAPNIRFEDALRIYGCKSQNNRIGYIGNSFSLDDSKVAVTQATIPVRGNLTIIKNPKLDNLTFWPSLANDTARTPYTDIGGDIIISNCTSLPSISLAEVGLKTISGSLNITSNAALASISFPDLISIEGSIFVSNCAALVNISLPNLVSIGGDIIVTDNIRLSNIAGFPNLQTISGKLDFRGSFSTVTLPKLGHAFNGFLIHSTNATFSCSEFDQYKSQKFIRGEYSCIHSSGNKNTSNTSPTENKAQSLSIGGKAGIGVSVGIVGTCIIAGLIFLWIKKKSKSRKDILPPSSELSTGDHFEKAEVPAISKPGELHGQSQPSELQVLPAANTNININRKSVPPSNAHNRHTAAHI